MWITDNVRSVEGFLRMLNTAVIVPFCSIPSPIDAYYLLKFWSRKATSHLCSKPCYSQILPGLYISNLRAAADRNTLCKLNITHILTIETQPLPDSTFENTHIITYFIRAHDTPDTNLLPHFLKANCFIDSGIRKGNVIVHCHCGVSRSATIVIAYIMEKYKMSYDEAFKYVRKRRSFINPNYGFVKQLKKFQQILNCDNRKCNHGSNTIATAHSINAGCHKSRLVIAVTFVVGILVVIEYFIGFFSKLAQK